MSHNLSRPWTVEATASVPTAHWLSYYHGHQYIPILSATSTIFVYLIYSASFRHMHIMRAAFLYSHCTSGNSPFSSATVPCFINVSIVILSKKLYSYEEQHPPGSKNPAVPKTLRPSFFPFNDSQLYLVYVRLLFRRLGGYCERREIVHLIFGIYPRRLFVCENS